MEIPNWRVRGSTYVVDSPFLRLRKDSLELPDGTLIDDYYVREGRGFSIIFALTEDHRVVLVRQFKYAVGRIMLELPAGLIDEGEDARDAAVRELAEETGYHAQSMEPVHSLCAEPSNSQTSMHIFLARGARRQVRQRLDVTEEIEVELATVQEVRTLVARGDIDSTAQVAAIYYVLENVLGAGRAIQPG